MKDAEGNLLAAGVKYTLRKMSHGRRIKLHGATASIVSKQDAINRERWPIREELQKAEDAAKLLPCTCAHEQEEGKDSHDETSQRCQKEGCECRKADFDPDKVQRLIELNNKFLELEYYEMFPAYIRWGVQDIQGLEIDGVPATIDSFLESGNEAMFREVVDEIVRLKDMSPTEQLSFKSPTTSGAPVDGQNLSSSAPIAN